MMAQIFIDGEAGTTGLQIRARLAGRGDLSLISLTDERRKEAGARREAMASADLVILCLPDEAAREAVTLAAEAGTSRGKPVRILDASTAHRVAPGWVYGFAERTPDQAEQIAAATFVANPGCYATGAIGLLAPLVAAGVLPGDYPVTIQAVSGYTGGGKAMIAEHEQGRASAFEIYALGLEHKHIPEIMHWSGLSRRPIMVPSVGAFAQGMLVVVPLFLADLPGHPRTGDLHALLRDHYARCCGAGWQTQGQVGGQVQVIDPVLEAGASRLDAATLADSDAMELRVFADPTGERALLVARLDNLGKGAAGAAVQNMDLMLEH
jgi:N-acetyl-gamma-glutamyl-phosphate reductase